MPQTGREQLLFTLHEAAELEHCLMCTYLYAAWSLKDRDDPGMDERRHALLAGWKQDILRVAIEEMSHLVSVWNITSALGGSPRVGRFNFPLDPGYLPASIIVKLVPFSRETLQHFIFLERPTGSDEPDGDGFIPPRFPGRGNQAARYTPMPEDYDTVGRFYNTLKDRLNAFVQAQGESRAFCGNPSLQIPGANFGLPKARPVLCAKTALQAFDAIVAEGEGASIESRDSHYLRFVRLREAYDAMLREDPDFRPALPAATNPVLRAPPQPQGKVWLEDPKAIATVDLANAAYGLMLRLLAYAYVVPTDDPHKSVVLQLSIGLMHAISALGEAAVRLPAGPSNPHCNAGVSFAALRDAAALPPGVAADNLVRERLHDFAEGAAEMASWSPRHARAAQVFAKLAQTFETLMPAPAAPAASAGANSATSPTPAAAATQSVAEETPPAVEIVPGPDIEIHYTGRRCIHARFCVTGAPKVFLANVQGPWIHPEAMPVERLVDIAHACPSGAIQYRRLDGKPDEAAPPVNLVTIREAGPLAVRADIRLNGETSGMRATLCRCGASQQKPFCDGSHKEIGFSASGEPRTQGADMLPVRDGPLHIEPEVNGPLQVTGNVEIISGTGRVVARVTAARLCRCGSSQNKPFCDGTHERIGFKSG